MTFREVAPPTVEPISLAAAKLHCRATTSDEDVWMADAISSAREQAELITGLVLVSRQFEVILDEFPDAFELPSPPVRAVATLKYTDLNGAEQTLSAASYTLDKHNKPAYVVKAYAADWPATRADINAVRLRYTAGHMAPCTVDAPSNVITAAGHGYASGDLVPFSTHGTVPGGLADGGVYYAINVSANTLKVSQTEGGSEIDITSAGAGQHFLGVCPPSAERAMLLLIAHYYAHREAVSDFQKYEVPQSVMSLLSPLTTLRL